MIRFKDLFIELRAILPSAAILIFLTRLGFIYWPPIWPDEALFSSPAANLATNGKFTTPVLYGLIPGMDEGTLWNSPLFMVLTAGVYFFSGESVEAGRTISLILGLIVLYIFSKILRVFTGSERIVSASAIFLAFDPVFIRASNVIRMDMLTLLFVLIAFYQLLRERESIDSNSSDTSFFRRYAFIAGLATGLAGISHPFAVILIPIWLLMVFPSVRSLMNGAFGGLIGFSPWAAYILQHIEIFQIQFVSQLTRKQSMATLWGGDTGGIFVVFSSQYGGGKVAMIIAALTFVAFFTWTVIVLINGRASKSSAYGIRLFLSFAVLMSFILVSSEGWYALYASPFALILSVSYFSWIESDNFLSGSIARLGLAIIGIPLFVLSFMFFFKNTYRKDNSAAAADFFSKSVSLIEGCRSVYIRTRPDPYFHIRKLLPDTKLYEFVPGKLRFDDDVDRIGTYSEIECFYLDNNDDWEPELSEYLSANESYFKKEYLADSEIAGPITLWRRVSIMESLQ